MAWTISPPVSDWVKQVDAFLVQFTATDNNGVLCTDRTSSVQYKIAPLGTNPDLLQMLRAYSDASGVISITITEPCVISLYGFHAKDVTNLSLGEETETFAIDYVLTFEPVVLALKAEYNGPDVPIGSDFNPIYLSIEADLSDGSTKVLTIHDINIPDYTITQLGPNKMSLTYIDPVLNANWTAYFYVPGTFAIADLRATYTGPTRTEGSLITKAEIIVEKLVVLGPAITQWEVVLADEWEWVNIPIISSSNGGTLHISHLGLTTSVTIPMESLGNFKLYVWYEGEKIEVGCCYDPDNVVILMETEDGDRIRIGKENVQFDSYLVEHEGWNYFVLIYMHGHIQYRHAFPVLGYIRKDYVDFDFKVLYIRNEDKYEDITELLRKELSFDGILSISWKQFLHAINNLETKRYGRYKVMVPKQCGMSKLYDSEWTVTCINERTIKAQLDKMYYTDEEE